MLRQNSFGNIGFITTFIMKARFHKIQFATRSSYHIRHEIVPNLSKVWHYHPELELHYVVRGEGVRFIGDQIANFSAGEIILVGEYLPHTWRCKDEYFKKRPDLEVETIVIQFTPDCLGSQLLDLPEAFLLPKLFEKAKCGMVIHGATRKKVAALMQSAVKANRLNKLVILLSIFKLLSETSQYELITSSSSVVKSIELDDSRINKVTNFIMENYKDDITLEQAASMSNLSLTSFCRYFKMMTKKTFTEFLTEIRISHACGMIVQNKFTIDVICFDCGFKNLSNFYRHFKTTTGMTPKEYKKKIFA